VGRLVIEQIQAVDAGHLLQHACGQGVGLAVVVDVNVQPIHHIEMRIRK